MSEQIYQKLNKIQEELDEKYIEFIKQDFSAKLAHQKNISKILEERDNLLNSLSEKNYKELMNKAFENFEPITDYFPKDKNNNSETSIIKSIKAEYLDDLKMKVVVELYPNEYVENTVLEKTLHLIDKDPESVEIKWKDEQGNCPLFEFFETDENDFESFDIFYEFYLNLAFYSTAEE